MIAQSWTVSLADEFLRKVDHTIELVEQYPFIGRIASDDYVRAVPVSSLTTMFYWIDEDKEEILLLLFWDNRQSSERLEEELKKIKRP